MGGGGDGEKQSNVESLACILKRNEPTYIFAEHVGWCSVGVFSPPQLLKKKTLTLFYSVEGEGLCKVESNQF